MEEDGKLKAVYKNKRDIEGEDDTYTTYRDDWTLFDYNKQSHEAQVYLYRNIDLKCLYMWILHETKIAQSL